LTHELLKLDPLDLETLDLDEELAQVRVSVPPLALSSVVLEPAIKLGEEQIQDGSKEETSTLVGKLHATKACLILEHTDTVWPFDDPLRTAVAAYDRAIELDAEPFESYAGRASARFRRSDRDLREVLADLDQAITRYPDPPQSPTATEPPTNAHRQLARLHYARGNVVEMLADAELADDEGKRYDEAAQVHARAGALDPSDARYPLAIARSMRKRAVRWPLTAHRDEALRPALQLLDEAAELDPKLAEVYNERGEVQLSLGDVAEARQQFAKAVELGLGNRANLYRYYCNQANSHTRDPATLDDYRDALAAADKAIALRSARGEEAYYYRGLALWRLNQTRKAVEAFEQTSMLAPTHVGALLARCQIIFETQEPQPTNEQLQRAHRDVNAAIKLVQKTPTTNSDKAKAYYVRSLAWLKHHVDSRSEESLVKCQEDLVSSLELSRDYVQSARKVFDYATGFTWEDAKLREESQRLQEASEPLRNR